MTCENLTNKTIYRSDNDIFTVNFFTDTAKTIPQNITGYEVRMTVRLSEPKTDVVNDDDAKISSLAVIPVGTDGKAEFNITSDETDIDPTTYWYDIQYKKPSGAVKTVGKARYIVNADITRDN
jgi:hypothetical protein